MTTSTRLRNQRRWIAATCPRIAVLLTLVQAVILAQSVRVTSQRANVRLNPSTTSPVIATMPAGTVLDVESREGDWYRVSLPPDPSGFRRIGFLHLSVVEPWKSNDTPATVEPTNKDDRAGSMPPSAAPTQAPTTTTDDPRVEIGPANGPTASVPEKTGLFGRLRNKIPGIRVKNSESADAKTFDIDDSLTAQEVEAAIKAGKVKRVDSAGLQLTSWSIGQADLHATLFTPTSWIELAAATAASNFKPFTMQDVTEDMLSPVLRVFITMAITNVVLRDVNERQVIQPSAKAVPCDTLVPFWVTTSASTYNSCQEFVFDLAALKAIRAVGKGEFLVTASALSEHGMAKKDFRIKDRHFAKLP